MAGILPDKNQRKNMKNVIIIGAGSHAAEIDEYIKHSQQVTGEKSIKVIGFLDDNPVNYTKYRFSALLLGRVDDHTVSEEFYYIIGIAGLCSRKAIVDRFRSNGARFLNFQHCSAYVSDSAVIGEGNIIGPNANIGPNVRVGNFNLINSRCSLGHDTIIGNFNFISPNVCFSGFTRVGDENLFGINSASVPDIIIGSRNKIAAGMILDQNVGDESIIFYRFKEKVISILK
jgi:sugar O-acyltransferase (sialic acid O-acetyltransferase NeuD family)